MFSYAQSTVLNYYYAKARSKALSFIAAGRIYDSRRRRCRRELIIDLEFCVAYGIVRVPLSR